MRTKAFRAIFQAILMLVTHLSLGQVEYVPQSDNKLFQTGSIFSQEPNFKNKSAISLPFFEDFSSYLGDPKPLLWDSLGGAKVALGVSYHPPTLGTAMFDGLDENGRPYEFRDGFPKGATDYLESQPIDLSTYFSGDSLYLSFYWQQGGRGDAPEFSHRDSLMLDFWFDTTSKWEFQWGRIAKTTDSLLTLSPTLNLNDTFFIAMIPLNDPRFFVPDFRFRFRTRGSQSGSFDIWNVDYVFLDANRNKNDIYFLDRALTETTGTVFNGFSAVPISHALNIPIPELFNLSNSTQVRTLDKTFSVYDFDVTVKEEISGNIFYEQSFKGNLIDGYFSTQKIVDTTNLSLLSLGLDSQIISKTFILTGNGDSIRRGYDARVNDTLSIYGSLMDFYAYDDGISEGSMGIRHSYGKVAYQYILFEPDTLTALDIQFKPADENLSGLNIGLRIWKKLNKTIDEIIYAYNTTLTFPEIGEEFYRFEFDSAVLVADTIYIGWIQFTDDLVHVGYDQNNNSNQHLFSKTQASGWRAESDFFPGSMLFRPVLAKVDSTPIATIPQKKIQKPKTSPDYEVRVGPNPSNGIINVYGDYDKIRLVDHQGKVIWEESGQEMRKFLDLSILEDGFYLIYFEKEAQFSTQRIYLKK